MKKLVLVLALMVICCFGSTYLYAAEDKVIAVNVNSKVMKEISSWDKQIVFLTSAKNPIRNFNDISKRRGEVGVWGGELYVQVLKLSDLAGLKVYAAEKPDDKAWRVPFRIIGNSYHARLFTKNPNLLLFVTYRDSAKDIVKTGGGIEIRFQTAQ